MTVFAFLIWLWAWTLGGYGHCYEDYSACWVTSPRGTLITYANAR